MLDELIHLGLSTHLEVLEVKVWQELAILGRDHTCPVSTHYVLLHIYQLEA